MRRVAGRLDHDAAQVEALGQVAGAGQRLHGLAHARLEQGEDVHGSRSRSRGGLVARPVRPAPAGAV
ncbi:hypothetical protein ACU4GA_02475 [Methylobacterium oryzae CBMB20]